MNDARTDCPEAAATPRLIEEYALIGSTEAAALVHRSGTIEWLCLPAFDSDAIFAALLGTCEHGAWHLGAVDPQARISRRYLPDPMSLETTIETDGGRAVVCDAYALSERMDEAKALLERLLSYGNDLGLIAEVYDPQGCRQRGNFPQAFSQFAPVNSAHSLLSNPTGVALLLADDARDAPGEARG